MTTAACFVSGGSAPGAALQALLTKESLSLAAVSLVCCEQQPQEQVATSSSKFTVVLAASSSPHNRESLARIARSTAPGGRLYVYEEATSSEASAAGIVSRFDALKKDLLLSGFTDAEELTFGSSNEGTGAKPYVWVSARLPQWGLGASAKLSLKRPAGAASAQAQPQAGAPAAGAEAAPRSGGAVGFGAANVWKLGNDDNVDEDEELLDDDQLLTAEDKKPSAAIKPDDCEVGQSGRKACKNCSCGRAEAEAAAGSGSGVKLTADLLDNPQSACGNCYLGDAFRCASCPYRGLPAFEPGQKITLGANMLAADA